MNEQDWILHNGQVRQIKDAKARQDIGDLDALKTNTKNSLVEAINQAAASSGGGGDIIQDPEDEMGGVVVSGDGIELDRTLTDPNKAAPADIVGEIKNDMLHVDDNNVEEIEIVEKAEFDKLSEDKQDKLTAGENIRINGNVISAVGGADKSLEERVEKLEAAAEGNLYMFREDSEEAYEKAVPADAMKWGTLDNVGAKTLVWNQLVNSKDEWSLGGKNLNIWYPVDFMNGHTYLFYSDAHETDGAAFSYASVGFWNAAMTEYVRFDATHTNGIHISVRKFTSEHANLTRAVFQYIGANSADDSKVEYRRHMVIDLTQMFGAGNEPTAEEFRAMFPADYYPYSEPTLMTYSPDKVVSNGRNLFDKSTVSENKALRWKDGVETDETDAFLSDYIAVENGAKYYSALPLSQVAFYNAEKVCNYIYKSGLIPADGVAGASNVVEFTVDKADAKYVRFSVRAVNGGLSVLDSTMLMKTVSVSQYAPHRAPITTDLHPLVAKYFPNGMKSAGTVHDEIDLERGVAVQRVGSELITNESTISRYDSNTYFWTPKNKYAYPGNFTKANMLASNGYEITATNYSKVPSFSVGSTSIKIRTAEEYANAIEVNAALNGVAVVCELAEPIETPIDPADLAGLTDLNVEAGGSLTFTNQHGDDYRVPLPNQETFMIKLGGGNA